MHTTLEIHGMHCASCVGRISQALRATPGVTAAQVNFALEKAHVEHDAAVAPPAALIKAVIDSGYDARLTNPDPGMTHHDHQAMESARLIRARGWRTIIALVLSVVILGLGMDLLPIPNAGFLMLLAAIGVLATGAEFFRLGLPALWHRRPEMNSLIALGVGAAFLYSSATTLGLATGDEYFMDVGIITTFLLFGRWLEARAKGKASEAIKKLLQLSAKVAHRRGADGTVTDVPIEQVQPGDQLVVKPGEKIPVDGALLEGSGTIDESMVTGESIPVDRGVGDKLIGATINGNQSFVMVAEKVGGATLLAHIVKLVEEAQMSRAPIQKLVDVVSRYFVWGVMAVAIITAGAWWLAGAPVSVIFMTTVAVLIIACPCALGLATPIAIVVGTGRGAQLGILIKNTESLEKMHHLTAIAFDKTGTITAGRPVVREWWSSTPMSPDDWAALAAVESQSEHPLAHSVVRWISEQHPASATVQATAVTALAGHGITGTVGATQWQLGKANWVFAGEAASSQFLTEQRRATTAGQTIIAVAKDGQPIGFFGLQDPVKESSSTAIASLHRRKLMTMMVTGDNQVVAEAIAKEVGIDQVRADTLPEDKVKIIKELQDQGQVVAMIGDGINDSPALAQANVGIAMGTGTDIAMETGDVVLVKGDLQKAAEAIELSRATLLTIKQNLFWAFAYNVVGIPIAAFGLLNPKLSAAAMAFSSVSVVLNALRLKRRKLV